MVRIVLRPLYQDQRINKDEYTDINRDVSRMLYDKVAAHKSGLEDEHVRKEWQRTAQDEVERMVAALRLDKSDVTPDQSEDIATANQEVVAQEA